MTFLGIPRKSIPMALRIFISWRTGISFNICNHLHTDGDALELIFSPWSFLRFSKMGWVKSKVHPSTETSQVWCITLEECLGEDFERHYVHPRFKPRSPRHDLQWEHLQHWHGFLPILIDRSPRTSGEGYEQTPDPRSMFRKPARDMRCHQPLFIPNINERRPRHP